MKPQIFIVMLILPFTHSCKNQPDLETEKNAILILHEEQRKAHIEKNASLLVSQASPDFTIINHGVISKPSKEESIRMFQSYFDAVDFVKWDDISPPVFSFSDDAGMATSVVNKLVITREKKEGNRLDTVHYAWLAVYKKHNGKWEMERMGSTNN